MSADVTQIDTTEQPFEWSDAATNAAVMVAEDRVTDETIARRVGVSRSTLARWKRIPAFRSRVNEHFEEMQERARRRGIARLDRRMDAYNDRHRRMTKLIRDRGKDLKGEIAGGDTGALVRKPKTVEVTVVQSKVLEDGEMKTTTTRTREEVFEYAFDAALFKELRELEKQVSIESGTWAEKVEHSGGVEIEIVGVDVEAI